MIGVYQIFLRTFRHGLLPRDRGTRFFWDADSHQQDYAVSEKTTRWTSKQQIFTE